MAVSELDVHARMRYMNKIISLFNHNIELENVLAPKMDEYDPLIDAYRQLTQDLQLALQDLSKEPHTNFTDVMTGMVQAMISVTEASTSHWLNLKGKAFNTEKYGFFDNRRDTKHIRELVKERQHWGAAMNGLKNDIKQDADKL